MRGPTLSQQGLQSSNECAYELPFRVCRAPIKVSYFMIMLFGYQLYQQMQASRGASTVDATIALLKVSGYQLILVFTVLCHEFGHGNMARRLGGEIQHILLWVFGGVCFHTGADNGLRNDNGKILRNDLLIVAAGPCTHFLQAPCWCLLLSVLFAVLQDGTGYGSAWEACLAALHPFGYGFNSSVVYAVHGQWVELCWFLIGTGIHLNVALFIFNVFFPMYPADGSKLMVTGLMFLCGVSPRCAALILVITSTTCALLMVSYGAYLHMHGGGMVELLMCWLAVMSLAEARKIWDLRKRRLLHTHNLFFVARSWQRVERGNLVHGINQSDFDDEARMRRGSCRDAWVRLCEASSCGGSWTCVGCLTCMLPCLFRPRAAVVAASEESSHTSDDLRTFPAPDAAQVRAQRDRLLARVEQQRVAPASHSTPLLSQR